MDEDDNTVDTTEVVENETNTPDVSAYEAAIATRDATIAEKDATIESLNKQLTSAKAENYELFKQIPGDNSVTENTDTVIDDGPDFDDFFTKG